MKSAHWPVLFVGLCLAFSGCNSDNHPAPKAEPQPGPIGKWQHDYGNPKLGVVWRLEFKPDKTFSREYENTRVSPDDIKVTGSWRARAEEDRIQMSWLERVLERVGLKKRPETLLLPSFTLELDYWVPKGTEIPVGATVVGYSRPESLLDTSHKEETMNIEETYTAFVRKDDATGKAALLFLYLPSRFAELIASVGHLRDRMGPWNVEIPEKFTRID